MLDVQATIAALENAVTTITIKRPTAAEWKEWVYDNDATLHQSATALDTAAQTIKTLDSVNRELRRDLDGTCVTLRQTEDSAQTKIDTLMEMLEAARREANEHREKAFRLQNALDEAEARIVHMESTVERELTNALSDLNMYRRAYNGIVEALSRFDPTKE